MPQDSPISGEQPEEGQSASEQAFPREGCLLGVDYGQKRVGLAISTFEQNLAMPMEIYQRKSESVDQEWFRATCLDYRVAGLVVGLPLHTSGEESELSQEARQFGEWLARCTSLPLRFWDERYTSVSAELLLWQDGVFPRSGNKPASGRTSGKSSGTGGSSPQNRSRKKAPVSPVDKLAAHMILTAFLAAENRELWSNSR